MKWGRGGGGEGVLAACLIAGSELRDRQGALRKTRGRFLSSVGVSWRQARNTGTISLCNVTRISVLPCPPRSKQISFPPRSGHVHLSHAVVAKAEGMPQSYHVPSSAAL